MAPLKLGKREVRQTRGFAGLAGLLITACLVVLVAGGQAQVDRTLFELDKDATNNNVSQLVGVLNVALPTGTAATTIQICQVVPALLASGSTILIDAERMTVGAGSSAPGGGCANKTNYPVTRSVAGNSDHAKAENVTLLVSQTDAQAPGDDWEQIYDAIAANPGGSDAERCTSLGAIECAFTHDERSASIFTQSKDYDEISGPPPRWQWRDQSVPDADELDDGFAAKYIDSSGEQHLYFGADRFATNGTKDAGFWFFHDEVKAIPPVGTADGLFSGVHTAPSPGSDGKFCVQANGGNVPGGQNGPLPACSYDSNDSAGDILILTTFTGGGATTTVRVFEWIGPAGSVSALLERGAAADCVPASTPEPSLCATVNTTTIESPWAYSGKSEPANDEISSGGFLEGAINLSDFGLEGCFSSFMATSRSSASLTADPKDFILGNFEVCGAKISITPDDVNEVGENHTFTVKVFAGVTGQETPIAGVKPNVTLTATNGAVVVPVAENCSTTGTNGSGECTVTFTSNTAGTVTGHAAATVTFEGRTFNVETNGQAGNSGDAVKRFVDASIAIAPNGVNEVGEDHVFTVTVTPNAPAGASVSAITITPSVTPAPDELASNCDTVAVAGPYTCTITISDDQAGLFTANASVSITFTDGTNSDTVVRSTSGNNGPIGSGPAEKRFVDASIAIAPNGVNEVGEDHVFTVTVTPNAPAGASVSAITITPSVTPAPDELASNCDTVAVAGPYTCTITISDDQAGLFTANASVSITFTDGTNSDTVVRSTSGNNGPIGSGPAEKRFVDASIAIAPNGVNEVGEDHVFTVTVTPNAPAGASVSAITITPSVTPAPDELASNCDTVAVAGPYTCTITISDDQAGLFTANASVSITFTDGTNSDTVVRSTSGNNGPIGSGPAEKRFVDASIAIAPNGVNEVGEDHVFTVTVTPNAPAGASVSAITITPSVTPAPDELASNCDTVAVAGPYTCTITISDDQAGLFTANASVSITFTDGTNSDTVVRSTSGNNGPIGSGPATKRFVDAYITIGPNATNIVGDDHTFTVNVFQDDGLASGAPGGDGADGFGPAPNGTEVLVTLTSTDGAAHVISSNTCDAPDGTVGGACSITFTSATAGTVTGHAAVTFLVGGQSLFRETDGVTPNSPDAVKVFIAGSITWEKEYAGELQGGATFSLCRTHDYNLVTQAFDPITPVCIVVVDNTGQQGYTGNDADADPGQFEVAGQRLGRYVITETAAPPGYELDPNPQTVELVPGTTTVAAGQRFVNSRPVLKITGFGYTNEPDGAQPNGIRKGTTTFTATLKNYGTAKATLSNSSLTVSPNASCGILGNTIDLSGTEIAAGASSAPITLTCTYDNPVGEIVADLVVNYTTNGVQRSASGSPAQIRFTVPAADD